MIVGLVGLGRMGQSIAARLVHGGFDVIAHDPHASEMVNLSLEDHISTHLNASGRFVRVKTLKEVAEYTRIIWLMVPAGEVVDGVINGLLPHLEKGSIIIDGGNSFFKDSIRRFALLQEQNIEFLDCGTSGGLHGRAIGFSLMIGGLQGAFVQCETVFKAIAAPDGYALVGPAGAGHYVKMVHNGIEYGLLQAYAEGFHVLKEGHYKDLNLSQISNVWMHGSVIRSWLLELCNEVFTQDQELSDIYGAIAESGTGAWTVEEAQRQNIPVPVIERALAIRADSRKTGGNYATKLVALLRQAFGGHPVTYVFYKKNTDN